MTKTLHTIDALIDELGGPTALARFLGVTAGAVTNWRARGHIPSQWYRRLRRDLLDQRDVIVSDSLFDFHDVEPPPKAAVL